MPCETSGVKRNIFTTTTENILIAAPNSFDHHPADEHATLIFNGSARLLVDLPVDSSTIRGETQLLHSDVLSPAGFKTESNSEHV